MQIKQYLFLVFIFCTISSSIFYSPVSHANAQNSIQQVYLTFTDSDGNTLYKLDLKASSQTSQSNQAGQSNQWIVRWNHSVTGITVSDYYYWDGQNMLLTDSHTPAFDACLGHIPGRGTLLSDGQNGYYIFDIDEHVPNNSYALRVGSLKVNHRIIHNGNTYSLSEVAERQRVIISVTTK